MRHFLVIAAASRGGRLFVKKALSAGHNVTALCRASSDTEAANRLNALLTEAELTTGGAAPAATSGTLKVLNRNILDANTYRDLLNAAPSIDAIVCFVGPTKFKDMMNPRCTLYADTIAAMLEGMQQSRAVEVLYHSSVGADGPPHSAKLGWPSNFPLLSRLVPTFFPVFKNLVTSERQLTDTAIKGLEYIVFRPATLTDAKARRHYGRATDYASRSPETLPMEHAKTTIAREDVAEEILRVASLPKGTRSNLYGYAIYLADLKTDYRAPSG